MVTGRTKLLSAFSEAYRWRLHKDGHVLAKCIDSGNRQNIVKMLRVLYEYLENDYRLLKLWLDIQSHT